MLFHLPKFPAEIRVSHLNARINEQRKKIAQTTASKFELLQLSQQFSKEARARKKNNQKIYVLDFKGDMAASAVGHLAIQRNESICYAYGVRDRYLC